MAIMTSRRLSEGPAEGHAIGLEAVLDYFVERDVRCTVVPHSETATARAEARASAVDPHEMARIDTVDLLAMAKPVVADICEQVFSRAWE